MRVRGSFPKGRAWRRLEPYEIPAAKKIADWLKLLSEVGLQDLWHFNPRGDQAEEHDKRLNGGEAEGRWFKVIVGKSTSLSQGGGSSKRFGFAKRRQMSGQKF